MMTFDCINVTNNVGSAFLLIISTSALYPMLSLALHDRAKWLLLIPSSCSSMLFTYIFVLFHYLRSNRDLSFQETTDTTKRLGCNSAVMLITDGADDFYENIFKEKNAEKTVCSLVFAERVEWSFGLEIDLEISEWMPRQLGVSS